MSATRAWRRVEWRALGVPAAIVVAWQAAVSAGWVDVRVVAPPLEVLRTLWTGIASGEIARGVAASLARALVGFVLGSIAGFATGLLLALSRPAGQAIGPTLRWLKHISVFAWLPLISTFLGNGDPAKLLFIALAAYYPVALATLDGLRRGEQRLLEVAAVYRFTASQRLRLVLLPGAKPYLVSGVQLALMLSWMAAIGAEYLLPNFSAGIGNVVMRGKAAFRVEIIVAGLLVIGVLGALLHRASDALARRWLTPRS